MTDYRFVMGLLLQGYAYRQIEAMAGCSHRAIARARRVLDEEGHGISRPTRRRGPGSMGMSGSVRSSRSTSA